MQGAHKNPMSSTRYVLHGTMTREQAVAVAEALSGSSVLWDRGHTFPENDLFVAPERCQCNTCVPAVSAATSRGGVI